MSEQIGPKIKLNINCSNCKYLNSEPDLNEGVMNFYCSHPYFNKKIMGYNSNVPTPNWCPELKIQLFDITNLLKEWNKGE